MSPQAQGATPADDRELVFERIFEAPRDLVFTAWTQQAHIEQWWGPDGFTTTTHEMDVRPGGVWRFIMHAPDGTDFPNRVEYEEVEAPRRLVYAHSGEEGDPVHFHVTVTFADEDGGTRVTMRMRFATKAERDEAVEKYGAIEGAHQTLARLEAHLSRMARP